MAALLSQEKIPRNLIDTAIRMAESVADELTRGDDREVRTQFHNSPYKKIGFCIYLFNFIGFFSNAGLSRRIIRITTRFVDS